MHYTLGSTRVSWCLLEEFIRFDNVRQNWASHFREPVGWSNKLAVSHIRSVPRHIMNTMHSVRDVILWDHENFRCSERHLKHNLFHNTWLFDLDAEDVRKLSALPRCSLLPNPVLSSKIHNLLYFIIQSTATSHALHWTTEIVGKEGPFRSTMLGMRITYYPEGNYNEGIFF